MERADSPVLHVLCPAPHTLGYHLATDPDPLRFSYDPLGMLIEDITGDLDPSTGEFTWTVAYHPNHA